jgi:peptidylprolyl isomerase
LKRIIIAIFAVTVLATVLLTGCSKGEERLIKNGDKITVEYTGTLADGTQFDSNVGGEPLEFTVGGGQMIAGFDKAVVGMKLDDTKTFNIPAAEAYGEPVDELILELNRDKLAPGMNPEVGEKVQMQSNGQTFVVTVVAVSDTTVTVDANHELAGKDLTFKVKILTIN